MALASAALASATTKLPSRATAPSPTARATNPGGPCVARFSPSSGFRAAPLASGLRTSWGASSAARKPAVSRATVRRQPAVVRAAAEGGSDDGQTFVGMYGPWRIEEADRTEVFLYRAGLVTAATSFVLAASLAFLPADSPLLPALTPALDPLFALGTAGLGVSLVLIHIYVAQIKRALQLLWAVGALGSVALAFGLAAREGTGVVEYVVAHGSAVWAVGPLFAALTGLVFKEGLCYGKLEAAALVFVIPTLLLSHLSGMADIGFERGLLAVWMSLFAVFAARKFTQPIKDDIGDKSVFIFQALPREKQEEFLSRINSRRENDEVL